MTLGNRIKTHRMELKLSQEKVAELVGVSRQAVTKWESDQSAPSTENLIRLAEVFGCSLDQLAKESDGEERSTAEDLYRLYKTDQERAVLHRKARIRCNLKAAGIFTAAYLIWFVLCKFIWADLGDQTLMAWLFGSHPLYHDYLFGWIIDYWLFCSLIGILPALFGKFRFCAVVTAGFIIGLPLGEYLGGIELLVDPGYHYGWAIWGGIWLASIVLGTILQRFPAEDLNRNSKKLRIWCIAAAGCILGILFFVLLNIPRHTWS